MRACPAGAAMLVSVFCVLSAFLTPPQTPAAAAKIPVGDTGRKRVFALICAATVSVMGTSRWGRVTGALHRACRPGEEDEEGVGLGQRNNERPPPVDAYTPCIKTPLAEPHLLFVSSLVAPQTIDGHARLLPHEALLPPRRFPNNHKKRQMCFCDRV